GGEGEERGAGLGRELLAQRIDVAQQAHVRGMLEIAEPDDARGAMRGAAVVSWFVLLDAEHADALDSEAVQRRAAHHPKPDHDHVEARHHATLARYCEPTCPARGQSAMVSGCLLVAVLPFASPPPCA